MSETPLLRIPAFRRLFGARVVSQLADGIFQASLAGAVFFNPDHATDARNAVLGFLVLYLPYSVVSPFAGVLLDRWRRQRSLLASCLLRVPLVAGVALLISTAGSDNLGLYLVALLVLGVSRFAIAALGAAMPHVVDEARLVSANALAGTCGTVAAFSAGGLVLVLRRALPPGQGTDALFALASAAGYLGAAVILLRFRKEALGPDVIAARTPLRSEAARVLHEMAAGARHLRSRPAAGRALGVISAYRLCMGALTLDVVLLYRNAFAGVGGALPGGQVGLGEQVAATAVGVLVSAYLTPRITARIGKPAWVSVLMVLGGASVAIGAPTFRPLAFLVAGLVVGAVGQGVKICIDTLLQEVVDDEFRGRAFAFYDALFNFAFAVGAVAAAFVLPASGRSYVVIAAVAIVFVGGGLAYARADRRAGRRAVSPVEAV